MQNVIAVVLPKGGTGKTTTAVNLAGALAAQGKKILLVDNDWQGSATVHCKLKEPDELTNTLADVLAGRITAKQAIRSLDHFDLLPGNGELVNVDLQLLSQGEVGVYRLREVLRPVAETYDVVLIDSEPGMHIRNLGALAAANRLLAPISADYLSIKTLKLFLRVQAAAQQAYKGMPRHSVGVIVTRFDGRQNQSLEVVELVKALAPQAGLNYLGLIIPERAAHRKAAAAGETVLQIAGDTAELIDVYNELARKVLNW